MDIIAILLLLFFLGNVYFLNKVYKLGIITNDNTIFLFKKASELEELSKELEIQDSKVSAKINEFTLVKRINDDTYIRQIDEMYLGGLELKKFTEDTINALDPVVNKNSIKSLNENLIKINTYLNSIQKQTPRNLNNVTYKSLSVKYNFSNN